MNRRLAGLCVDGAPPVLLSASIDASSLEKVPNASKLLASVEIGQDPNSREERRAEPA
jgi:hypothetical protein